MRILQYLSSFIKQKRSDESKLTNNDELNRLISLLYELDAETRRFDNINDIKAIERLAEIGDPEALPVLYKLSRHILMSVSRAADKAISRLNDGINKVDDATSQRSDTENELRQDNAPPSWLDNDNINDPQQIARDFRDKELIKEKPDFKGLQKALERFPEGWQINNGWHEVVRACKNQGRLWLANQCAVQGLSHYCEPRVTTWDYITVPADVQRCDQLRQLIRGFQYEGDPHTMITVLSCLKHIWFFRD